MRLTARVPRSADGDLFHHGRSPGADVVDRASVLVRQPYAALTVTAPWWKSAVVYQIYPRSFADTNGDGVGDLEGIRRHLDHLAWLGVDAIWLSPFYPLADGRLRLRRQPTTATSIPLFGTLDDFDRLRRRRPRRGIRVVIDWVPNHTSDQHPWFVESRSARDSDQAGLVRLARSGTRRRSAQQLDPRPRAGLRRGRSTTPTGQYYLHLLPARAARPQLGRTRRSWTPCTTSLRFWLDRGVDGFRIDVVHAIGKDADLPDDPPELVAGSRTSALNDGPTTHALLRGSRTLLDSYAGDRMMVGEVFLLDTARGRRLLRRRRRAAPVVQLPAAVHAVGGRGVAPSGSRGRATSSTRSGWPTWVLSNHDNRAPPHPLRLRGPGAGRRACCCSPCGARRSSTPGRSSACSTRRSPPSASGRPRRPRRLPGPHPVDPGGRPRLGSRPVAAVPARRVRAVAAPGAPRARHVDPPPLSPAPGGPRCAQAPRCTRASCSPARRRPTASWPGSDGRGDDVRRVVVSFADEPVAAPELLDGWQREI